jgi:hypothetical protein
MYSPLIQERETQGVVPAAATEKRIANVRGAAELEAAQPKRARRNRAHGITDGRRDPLTVP